ncbi:unnamed protein product [Phyllotreta striolata]|uniref:Protein LSM14 homolog B n=1 Tax=Phyllotreta striolata TaxID=444603 RepID=A0A9P0GUS2_PHYSR|nr:unnamed protein product [Phyllotreta striolata]
MATGMPELGSKISLISKADIRYEGRLFTVDPQECTIALASVRSFGTEDRDTQYPVPAQNQIYDYILFRGSDIKDIRVINNAASHPQPLNDPAIMQLSMPPHAMQPPQYPAHHVMRGPPVHMDAPPFQHPYGGIGSGLGLAHQDAGLAAAKPMSFLDLIGGSRSTSPTSLRSRKSPTNDQGVQTGKNRQGGRKPVRPIQPPTGQWNQQQQHQQRRKSGDRKDNNHQQHNKPNYHTNNQQQQQYNSPRGNWSNRGPMRNWSRPKGGAPGYRNNAPVGGDGGGGGRPRNMLKFDNDYDFEQANTEFEELMSQLGKVKLEEAGEAGAAAGTAAAAAASAAAPSKGAGDDADKKDDSGNETGAGENEQDDDQQHQEVFYDKTKSFFDKISCEAVEKAKGKSQRTDWRVERKLNSETFGVAATRRGAFRGRGGFRGSYRGGYRNNYYRQPQRNQQNKPPQQQQQQQQQPPQNQQQQQQQQSPATQQQQGNKAIVDDDDDEKGPVVVEKLDIVDLRDRPLAGQANDEEGAGEFVPEPVMAVK